MSSLQLIVKLCQVRQRFIYLTKIDVYNFLKVVSLSKSMLA